jgi:nicotinamide-nucleotide amidase
MPEANIGQAMVPQGFRPLQNERGTAPGLLRYERGKTFLILPGVPQEMEGLMQNHVLPFLRRTYKKHLEVILHRTLLTTGIGESMLAEKIGDPNTFLGANTTLAFLPRPSGVRLRISSHGKNRKIVERDVTRVETILRERAGKYIYGADDESLESCIVKLLTEQKKTLSTAESCTGGLIASMITDVPGSSAVFLGSIVAYANEVKVSELGVKQETLDAFGAVSEETAREMAEGGTAEKPVGTIWIALAERSSPTMRAKTIAKKLQGDFGRKLNRERASSAALEMLRRRLSS